MTNWLVETLDGASNCLCRGITGIDDAVGAILFPPPADEISPQDRERIRQSLWRVRRDLAGLTVPNLLDDISRLLNDAFGGPDAFAKAVKAWADLVDDLVMAAEQDYGGDPGRGFYKKRNVKGALLYLVRRSNIDVPNIPAFVTPIVWYAVLDSAIDFLAQFSNRHDLWGTVPPKPWLRQRVQVQIQRVGGATESMGRWLTNLVWSLIFLVTPVSPALKKCVDRFLAADPQPMRSLLLVATWLAQHTAVMVALSDLLSIAVDESQLLSHADDEWRKAYAREVVLDFIEQETGLPDRNSLAFRLIESGVDVGIEVIVMLFEKHGKAGPGPSVAAIQSARR